MRFLLSVAAMLALSCVAALADPPPPKTATALSKILQSIEANADFGYFDEIEWDDGFYEIDLYTNEGTKRKIYVDPMSGEQRP